MRVGVGGCSIASDPCACRTLISFPHKFLIGAVIQVSWGGVPGLPVTLVLAGLYPFLISFIIEAVIQVSVV